MEHRNRAAVVILIPAFLLGLAACGGSSAPPKQTTVSPIAKQHWKAGLVHWKSSTQHALNALSVMFSTDAALMQLGREASNASHHLVEFEGVLVHCSETVRGLGPVPPGYELAKQYALLACKNLEQGEQGVEALVVRLRKGEGFDTLDPLTGAGSQLSLGQAQLNTVMHALKGLPE